MKSISSIVVFVFLLAPQIASAGWWNPTSWFSVESQVEEQKQPQDSISSSTPPDVPTASIKTADTKTIEDLRAEVTTLKRNLDNLEKRLSSLQNSTAIQPVSGGSDVAQRLTALEKRVGELPNPVTNDDTSRITKLEQKVAELSNASTDTVPVQAKNYDSQISEMAKRINALMHAGGLVAGFYGGPLVCTLGQQPEMSKSGESYPSCASVYKDLNY